MTRTSNSSMPVVQVAFSALDVEATAAWYENIFGFIPAGGMRGAAGPEVAAMMGLPTCHCDMRWLVDTSDFFQLEFFRFHDPVSVPGSRAPNDAGWSLVGLWVKALDAVLARLRESGAAVGPVLGVRPTRRVCTRDPEGVWLELRERVEGAPSERAVRDAPVSTAFVRAVVSDLSRAREFFCGPLGLRDTLTTLHTAADEALWDSPAADVQSCVLSVDGSRDDLAVELVQYLNRIPRPLPEGYRICDQGILNVAFGSRNSADYRTVTDRIQRAGYRLNGELTIGPARSSYAVGTDNLSVELLTIPAPEIERESGFLPSAPARVVGWREGHLHA